MPADHIPQSPIRQISPHTILRKQLEVIQRFELNDLSAKDAMGLIVAYSKMFESLEHQETGLESANPITSLDEARSELAGLYNLARTNSISAGQLGNMMKPLQALIASFDKAIPQDVRLTYQTPTEEQAELSAQIHKSMDAISDKIRDLGFQNAWLKREWKILTMKDGEEWSDTDQERLLSRMERKSYISVKKSK